MKQLFTIYRHKDLNFQGTLIARRARRAIIFKDDCLLLVKSEKYGELKFPGGGIDPDETPFQTLSREVMEETGYGITQTIVPFGSTVEFGKDFLGEYDIFKQESEYYLCELHGEPQALSLDDYEIDYGYHPVFALPQMAIANNEAIPANEKIPWKERDTLILKLLQATICNSQTGEPDQNETKDRNS